MPIVQHGPRGKPRVALTFDADLTALMRTRLVRGKVKSYYNEALINDLRRLRVPATLFLTGMWMEQYPDRTRELAADRCSSSAPTRTTTAASPSTATPSVRSPAPTCCPTYAGPS